MIKLCHVAQYIAFIQLIFFHLKSNSPIRHNACFTKHAPNDSFKIKVTVMDIYANYNKE